MRWLAVMGFLGLMGSCTTIYFNGPQPSDAKNLKKFPGKFRGTWAMDGNTTVVGKTYMKTVEHWVIAIAKTECDSSPLCTVRNDSAYFTDVDSPGEVEAYLLKDDSIYMPSHDVDSLFLSDSVLIRSVENHLFINVRGDDNWWTVAVAHRLKDGSIVSGTPDSDDHDLLVAFGADTSEHTDRWDVSLTKEQMLQFIDMGGFSDTAATFLPKDKVK